MASQAMRLRLAFSAASPDAGPVADDDSMSGVWGTKLAGTWTTMAVNPLFGATGYNAIFGIAADNIFAVGNGGTFSPSNTKGLHSVFANSPTDVWTSGDSGVGYHVTSGTKFTLPSATTGTLTNFHGTWITSGTDAYLVGDGGIGAPRQRQLLAPLVTRFTSSFRSIYGTAAQNVYVAGDNGVVLLDTGS
jgi:hypothetical protein